MVVFCLFLNHVFKVFSHINALPKSNVKPITSAMGIEECFQ